MAISGHRWHHPGEVTHVIFSMVYPLFRWAHHGWRILPFFKDGCLGTLWWHVELEASYCSYRRKGLGLGNVQIGVAGLLWWCVKHVSLIVNDPKVHPRASREPAGACRIHLGCFIKSCCIKDVWNIWWATCAWTRLSIIRQRCLKTGWFSFYCILAEVERWVLRFEICDW